MRTAEDVRAELEAYLGPWVGDYDAEAIVEDLKGILEFDGRRGYSNLDTLNPDVLASILQQHDTTE